MSRLRKLLAQRDLLVQQRLQSAGIELTVGQWRRRMAVVWLVAAVFCKLLALAPWTLLTIPWMSVRLFSRLILMSGRRGYTAQCKGVVGEISRLLAIELGRGCNLQVAVSESAAQTMDRLSGKLLCRAARAVAYGLPPDRALALSLDRLAGPMARRHASALLAIVGLDGDANMGQALNVLADLVEKEHAVCELAQSMCAESRMVATALPVLTLAVAGLLAVTNRGYIYAYLSPLGAVIAVAALSVMLLGAGLARRITGFANA